MRQWLQNKAGLPLDELVEEIPFQETRRYVKLVVGLAARYAALRGEDLSKLARLRVDPRVVPCIDF